MLSVSDSNAFSDVYGQKDRAINCDVRVLFKSIEPFFVSLPTLNIENCQKYKKRE